MSAVCPPCRRDECDLCDGTAWSGPVPTYCACWAGGHPHVRNRPTDWVAAERDPDPRVNDESGRMDAYERTWDSWGWGD